jgi:dihydroorotase
MINLSYPFETKEEANQYRKNIEKKTGEKYKTKKIIFTTYIYRVIPMKSIKKSI